MMEQNTGKDFLIVTHNVRFPVQFVMHDITLLQQMGYKVHLATNLQGETIITNAVDILKNANVVLHHISIVRSPFDLKNNVAAYYQLKRLMSQHQFSGVHCHTPMGGVVGRLAAHAANIRPVLYTAHGFHFYKGCPLKNRVIYESAERFLARYTDGQITINLEDYAAANDFPLRGKPYYIPGVGVDIKGMDELQVDRNQLRSELGISANSFVFVSIGEVNKNKNHETVVRAFAQANMDNAYYLICGSGPKEVEVQDLINKIGLQKRVKLLGFRKDAKAILKISDCFVFPSYREGLSVALMEAMAAGLPCIASRIRGNTDLLELNYEYLFDPKDVDQLSQLLSSVKCNDAKLSEYSKKRISHFSDDIVKIKMQSIYDELLGKATAS